MARRTNNLHSSDRQKDMDDLIRGLPSRSGKRREAKRWGKFALKILIILSVLAATAYGVNFLWERFVVFNKDFKLEKIQFETNGHMTEEEVRRILGLTGEENVLFLNTAALEEKMKSRADIVKASINRELPATLVVELEERVPVAWLECPQDSLYGRDKNNGKLVDSSGYIFSYDPELHKRYESSPVIRVAPPLDGHYGSGEWLEGTSARQGLSFLRTAKAFVNEGIPLVQSLDFVNDWSFVAHFPDGMAITFGLFDHERQLHDLALIVQHAKATNRSVRSANMMPVRNMPVVFGSRRDVPIVQAEVVDEEVPPANLREVERKPEKAAEETSGNASRDLVKDSARGSARENTVAQEKTAARNGGKSSVPAVSVSGSSSARKKASSSTTKVRAAEVVDDDEPAPAVRKKSSASGKTSSGTSASRNSGSKSSSVKKPSVQTQKKTSSGSSKKAVKQPQPKKKASSSGSGGTGNTSSGSSGGSKPAPQPPVKKPVEVPSFNW